MIICQSQQSKRGVMTFQNFEKTRIKHSDRISYIQGRLYDITNVLVTSFSMENMYQNANLRKKQKKTFSKNGCSQ